MASATLLLIFMFAALPLTSLGSSATPSSLPQPQTTEAAATIESWILSAMAPFLQAREVWKQQRANTILYPVIESLMKYGLPVIGIVVLLLVLYRLYPNAFRFLTIFGFLNHFGGGSATSNPVYGGRGFVGIVAGAISAASGVVLTLVRFMGRRRGAGTTETTNPGFTAIFRRSGGVLLAATLAALSVITYVRGPGPILNSIRAAATAPVRAIGSAFRNLRARVQRPAEPQEDLELQPILVPPPPDPQKPGLLQLL